MIEHQDSSCSMTSGFIELKAVKSLFYCCHLQYLFPKSVSDFFYCRLSASRFRYGHTECGGVERASAIQETFGKKLCRKHDICSLLIFLRIIYLKCLLEDGARH